MTQEPHSASRSPLAQPGATPQGNGESADCFARTLLSGRRERPLMAELGLSRAATISHWLPDQVPVTTTEIPCLWCASPKITTMFS
jgi:hypothetical protein